MSKARILIVDDEASVLDAYKKIFMASSGRSTSDVSRDRLNELEKKLFAADTLQDKTENHFEVEFCRQGPDAVAVVESAIRDDNPFAMAFLDVRMPPGPDGVWTAQQIRRIDPYINIVIVTAYSDISPSDIAVKVRPPEKLLYMQKPFHAHEIMQFASALYAKWQLEKDLHNTNQHLDELVKERTKELTLAIEALELSNKKYRQTAASLQKTEAALAEKAQDLEGTNKALQQMIQRNNEDQKEIEEKVLFAIHEMVEPYLVQLEKSSLDDYQKSFLKIIKANLEEITAPFMRDLSHKYFRLSPTEINIANLIKQGNSTREISKKLDMTKRNVDFYRDQIREKIGIKNTKANLKKVLQELEIEFSNR